VQSVILADTVIQTVEGRRVPAAAKAQAGRQPESRHAGTEGDYRVVGGRGWNRLRKKYRSLGISAEVLSSRGCRGLLKRER
jgi:hypothetical protein